MKHYSLKLNQCIAVIPDIRSISGNYPDITFHDIHFDSRKIEPGMIYVALKGINTDGHSFIQSAIQNGACAVIGTDEIATELSVPYIRVLDARLAMAWAAAALYKFPSNQMTVIGVTGTDGKTTTATLLYHILRHAGLKTSLISTVSAIINDHEIDTGFHVTTPESPDIQRYLAAMRDEGVTHVICETTSHGLAQKRVAAIDFDIGVVTNITHEHLDYHKSRESYFEAKGILFQSLGTHKKAVKPLAVLNHDDNESYRFLTGLTNVRAVSYSATGEMQDSVCNLQKMFTDTKGIRATISFRHPQNGSQEQSVSLSSHLLGSYNISNILAAMTAAVFGLNIAPDIAAAGIEEASAIPGRMEVIDLGQNFTAIVDFAHTPNALAVALDSVREMLPEPNDEQQESPARVIAIYGSAGLRDREKRRMMPEVSVKKADITIITAEDPRTEPLDQILQEMAAEALKHGGVLGDTVFTVPDRGDAIRLGLSLAKPGDVVIACGKGHEQSMCFETTEYDWDDRTAMRAALSEYLKIPGPEMPKLPTSRG